MSDTSRNDEVMKYCFGDDAEFVAVKHYERLQRELAEAREENKRLIADMILHERMSSQFQDEHDTLKSELNEMTARAISLSMHLPPQTLTSDVQKWRDEALEKMNSLKRELAEADQKWERRLIAALGGHADSKLWGDDGLIAATWRCVEGYQKMEKELAEARSMTEGQWLLKVAARLVTAGCKSDGIVDAMDELIQQRDTLAEALERIVMLGQSMPDLSYEVEIAKQALAAVKGGSHE